MLHAFLTGANYLIKKYAIEAKFCISIHDSILYMVKEEQAEKLVAIFQIAHAWSWAWLRFNYGIFELPVNNTWFSSVEVDSIFRKSYNEDVRTISNEIHEPEGRSYNIFDIAPIANSLF